LQKQKFELAVPEPVNLNVRR